MKRDRGGRRYSALVEFNGAARIVDDIRAHDAEEAARFLDRRRDIFFAREQIPKFQQKTYRVVGLFHGSIRFATE